MVHTQVKYKKMIFTYTSTKLYFFTYHNNCQTKIFNNSKNKYSHNQLIIPNYADYINMSSMTTVSNTNEGDMP